MYYSDNFFLNSSFLISNNMYDILVLSKSSPNSGYNFNCSCTSSFKVLNIN